MSVIPKGERINICFIGKTNVGKSTIINKLIGQEISIVSEQAGTTTDPVVKRFEIPAIGTVSIFDTAGYDDVSSIGEKRIAAMKKVLYRTDLAVVVLDERGQCDIDNVYIDLLNALKIPYIVVCNKADLNTCNIPDCIPTSIKNDDWRSMLLDTIVEKILSQREPEKSILEGLVKPNDKIIMVMPIDSSAPKGRIILPQVQVLREILDKHAVALCCSDKELTSVLTNMKEPPNLVITDSQVINFVAKTVPEEFLLTTFSILFSRYKGELEPFMSGLSVLKDLKDGDTVLIAEACSHHAMDEDIGTVKIPKWLQEYLGINLVFTKVNGHDFPEDLEKNKLVIHCGGCMLSRVEMLRRINECQLRGVPITNYGMLISKVFGSLDRVTAFNSPSKVNCRDVASYVQKCYNSPL